jgi:nucleotide-binding universal stress UspA family protein
MRQQRFPIVIALDDSEYAEIVLEHALDQAARHDAPDLHFVTVVGDDRDLDAAHERLARVVAEGLDTFYTDRDVWRTRVHVRRGKAATEIAALAGDVDARLLVIGRYGVHRRHGSVADRVVALAPCPTLVVGLADRPVPEPPCEASIALRESTDGETWFCREHAAPDRMRLSLLVPRTTSAHGGVW